MTRTLYYTAYSAARLALRDTAALYGHYVSPLSAGLDATLAHRDYPNRWRTVTAAARAAELPRSLRLRRSTRVMLRNLTSAKLMALHVRSN